MSRRFGRGAVAFNAPSVPLVADRAAFDAALKRADEEDAAQGRGGPPKVDAPAMETAPEVDTQPAKAELSPAAHPAAASGVASVAALPPQLSKAERSYVEATIAGMSVADAIASNTATQQNSVTVLSPEDYVRAALASGALTREALAAALREPPRAPTPEQIEAFRKAQAAWAELHSLPAPDHFRCIACRQRNPRAAVPRGRPGWCNACADSEPGRAAQIRIGNALGARPASVPPISWHRVLDTLVSSGDRRDVGSVSLVLDTGLARLKMLMASAFDPLVPREPQAESDET